MSAPLPTPSTILLIDEAFASRQARALMLTTHGYDVECSPSVADARIRCRRSRPDLILVGLSPHPGRTFFLLDEVRRALPDQRVAFLLHDQHDLCAVSVDGRTIIARETSGEMVERVASLLQAHSTPAARAL